MDANPSNRHRLAAISAIPINRNRAIRTGTGGKLAAKIEDREIREMKGKAIETIETIETMDDFHASAAYRKRVAAVLTARAIGDAIADARRMAA